MDGALTREQWLDLTDEEPAFGIKIRHREGRPHRYTTVLFCDSFEVWQADELEVILELWGSDVQEGDIVEIIETLSLPWLSQAQPDSEE
jgi:hypothetical protein